MPNRGGFSAKRAIGVTRAKQNFSRKTGIPTSRSGRQQKLGRATSGGCLALILQVLGLVVLVSIVLSVIF